MTNEYFDDSNWTPLPRFQTARAEAVNAIVEAVVVGFNKVPSASAAATDSVTYCVDTGAANAYVIAPTTPIVAYAAGMRFSFIAVHANSMASTVNVSGIGLAAIKRQDGNDLAPNDITAGRLVWIQYDGTNFQLMSLAGSDVVTSGANAAAAAASATATAGSASAAAGSASSASTNAGTATTQAGIATTQAGIATTQATAAAGSATTATTQAGNAATSATNAASAASAAATTAAAAAVAAAFVTGTFTPTDASGAGLTLASAVGFYRKCPGLVTVWGSFTYPSTADGNSSKIGGLPFSAANLAIGSSDFQGIVQFPGGGGTPGGSGPNWAGVIKNTANIEFRYAGGNSFTNALLSGQLVYFTATYPI